MKIYNYSAQSGIKPNAYRVIAFGLNREQFVQSASKAQCIFLAKEELKRGRLALIMAYTRDLKNQKAVCDGMIEEARRILFSPQNKPVVKPVVNRADSDLINQKVKNYRDYMQDMQHLESVISAANKAGLMNEVIVAAMYHLKEVPDSTIEDALIAGMIDWDI